MSSSDGILSIRRKMLSRSHAVTLTPIYLSPLQGSDNDEELQQVAKRQRTIASMFSARSGRGDAAAAAAGSPRAQRGARRASTASASSAASSPRERLRSVTPEVDRYVDGVRQDEDEDEDGY